MDHSHAQAVSRPEHIISQYIAKSQGLELRESIVNEATSPVVDSNNEMSIFQRVDGRSIRFTLNKVEEVLSRQDSEGRDFLQVNFIDGKKILITDKLVGFKPAETNGLDLKKLPKVVTTPDLVSVIEAIEESLNVGGPRSEEVEVLRRVFDSVLNGAMAVGFELGAEKSWLNLITNSKHKASA